MTIIYSRREIIKNFNVDDRISVTIVSIIEAKTILHYRQKMWRISISDLRRFASYKPASSKVYHQT